MSEKSRNLMLKNATTSSSQQNHSNNVTSNVYRGANIIAQLEAQKYPACFVACTPDFDNAIIPTCPPMLTQIQANSTSDG